MSVKINPADRVTVTNFRYNPSSSISVFNLSNIGSTQTTVGDGDTLVWDANTNQYESRSLSDLLDLGTYDVTGHVEGANLQIRYSDTYDQPLYLAKSELGYSMLSDTLYIGTDSGPVPIASNRLYELSDHVDGVTFPNSAVITGANGDITDLIIGEMFFDGSTINVLNPGSDLRLSPGGLGNISATGHRIEDLQDPLNPQDAVTKNYLDTMFSQDLGIKVHWADGSTSSDTISLGTEDLMFGSTTGIRAYYYNNTVLFDLRPYHVVGNTVGSSTEVPVITYDSAGRISSITTAPISTTVMVADDLGVTTDVRDTDTLQVVGGHGLDTRIIAPDILEVGIDQTANVIVGSIVAANLAYPVVDGTNGQILTTDGNGQIYWTDGEFQHVIIANTAPTGNLLIGDLWYSSNTLDPTGGRGYIWDGVQWIDFSPDGSSHSALITVASVAPSNPEVGHLWYDIDGTGRTYVWTTYGWVDANPAAPGASFVKVQNAEPIAPTRGTVWYSPANTFGQVWDGFQWIPFSDPDQTYVKNTNYVQTNEPPNANLIVGDMWYDTSPVGTTPYAQAGWTWDGARWVQFNIGGGVANTPHVIISDSSPANVIIGDIWFDSNTSGRSYVWDGVQWVDMSPQSIPEVPRYATSNVSVVAPSANLQLGDFWYDSDMASNTYGVTHIWTPSGWEPIGGGLDTEWVQINTNPPVVNTAGQLWFDSDPVSNTAGRLFVWDGTQWLDTNPQTDPVHASVTIANFAPAGVTIGELWYDSGTTGRTYLWDGIKWVDIAPAAAQPATLVEPKWYQLVTHDITTTPAGFSYNVTADYARLRVEFANCDTANNAYADGGFKIQLDAVDGTPAITAYEKVNIQTFQPFSTAYTFDNYVDGTANGQPTTFLNNEVASKLKTINVVPTNNNDFFSNGAITIWGYK